MAEAMWFPCVAITEPPPIGPEHSRPVDDPTTLGRALPSGGRCSPEGLHEGDLVTAEEYGTQNYVIGANIAGFLKVADAMLDQGIA